MSDFDSDLHRQPVNRMPRTEHMVSWAIPVLIVLAVIMGGLFYVKYAEEFRITRNAPVMGDPTAPAPGPANVIPVPARWIISQSAGIALPGYAGAWRYRF
jgi:hypothetical protein